MPSLYVAVTVVGGPAGAAIAGVGALCIAAALMLSRRAGMQSAVFFVILLWSVRPYNALADVLWGPDLPFIYRLLLGGLLWMLVWDCLHLLLGAKQGRLLGPKR